MASSSSSPPLHPWHHTDSDPAWCWTTLEYCILDLETINLILQTSYLNELLVVQRLRGSVKIRVHLIKRSHHCPHATKKVLAWVKEKRPSVRNAWMIEEVDWGPNQDLLQVYFYLTTSRVHHSSITIASLCYYILGLPSSTYILLVNTALILAIATSRPSRCHEPATGCTVLSIASMSGAQNQRYQQGARDDRTLVQQIWLRNLSCLHNRILIHIASNSSTLVASENNQGNEKEKKDEEEKDLSIAPCMLEECSIHQALIISKDEKKGNDNGATATQGMHIYNVPTMSTTYATLEQPIVEPIVEIPLSQNNLLDVTCDKEELCDDSLISMPQLVNEHVSSTVEPLCVEFKHVIYIASENEELKLLSSLNTWGYIQFDDLCPLNCLEKKLFASCLNELQVGLQEGECCGFSTTKILGSNHMAIKKCSVQDVVIDKDKYSMLHYKVKPRMVSNQERDDDEDTTSSDITMTTLCIDQPKRYLLG
uniref:OSJNBa0033H08.14 protein n=1 Tax=Oryza sativa subsp. japonica TaxID=39947 RepID=Q7XNR0_ORYSJ|nr:OSJNBa0033H08.14 [Oryza sativa Japonica Group]